MATCAKTHIQEHREEGGVKAKYWCHRCEQSKGHACLETDIEEDIFISKCIHLKPSEYKTCPQVGSLG